jgi:hypothetical protein
LLLELDENWDELELSDREIEYLDLLLLFGGVLDLLLSIK